ncbi:putative translocating chain-associated membrane protein 1-like [Apostichopus japonicus]|uniref:Putative translocating chain-associated membrane protein 1-like n=1 Tax=Stichopus japonicus TaxID=307972 RepID=A0A2G8JPA6_STIJA|nr:putative translocating chain-associated membrane protein 1-like [Apostichopus japonicus]
MPPVRRRGATSKNPPIFSHEFVIQNHADIVSCLAMLILVGLMFQYNVTQMCQLKEIHRKRKIFKQFISSGMAILMPCSRLDKFYFITQIAYWLHSFPELYFQKIKREEMDDRIKFAAFYLAFIVSAYVVNLTRLAILCLVLHYLAEMTFHLARILYFSDYLDISKPCFKLWFVFFLAARACIVILTVHTVWFGLGRLPNQEFDLAAGNFNTAFFRIVILAAVCLFQGWVLFDFLTFQIKRQKEQSANHTITTKKSKGLHSTPTSPKKRRQRRKKAKLSTMTHHKMAA